jgi:hypothetical protein
MENAQSLNPLNRLDQIRDTVVTVQDLANLAIANWFIALTKVRMFPQELDFLHRCLSPPCGQTRGYERQCIRNCPLATGLPPASRLFLPRVDLLLDFLIGDCAASVRIFQATLNHSSKRQFTKNLVVAAVFRLAKLLTRFHNSKLRFSTCPYSCSCSCFCFCSCSWSADQPSAANHVRVSGPAANVDGSAVPEQEQEPPNRARSCVVTFRHSHSTRFSVSMAGSDDLSVTHSLPM